MMRLQLVLVGLLILLGVVTVVPALAQPTTCQPIVEEALRTIGDSCGALGVNTICYGNNEVQADFREEQPVNAFAQPADTVKLPLVELVRTSPLDLLRDEWGVAVMSLQANVPDTLPGQRVVFLLMGDARLEDAAEGNDERATMQSFYFSGGISPADCLDAPSTLAIRTPKDVSIDLTVNGLEVIVGSLVTIRDNQNNRLTVTVHEGSLAFQTNGVTVNAGQSIILQLDSSRTVINSSAPFASLNPELALFEPVANVFAALDGTSTISTTPGSYTIQPGDNLFRIALNNGTCVSAIARANDIPFSQVRNVPAGRTITIPDGSTCGPFVNDVPPPASQPPAAPPPPNTAPEPNATEEPFAVDCSGLSPTSPRDGLAFGNNTFYWNGIEAAQVYVVNVYRDGVLVRSARTPAPNTQLTIDLSDIEGRLATYTWDVVALAGGVELCRAATNPMRREWPRGRDYNDGY